MFVSLFTKTKNILLDILFPPLCVKCSKPLADSSLSLCEPCFSSLSAHTAMFCPVCMRRLPLNKKTCHRESSYILGAAGNYDDPALKSLIHALKYSGLKQAAYPLASFLILYSEKAGLDFKNYLVLPVPLSKKRLRERGFNQAEIIARIFAEHYKLELRSDLLNKVSHTKPQAGLNRSERETNLRNCFGISTASDISRRNILLIDDVCTTGSTLNEASRVLKDAGAKKIIALVAARA